MSIHDFLAADIITPFSDFGESATYTPADISATAFTVNAVFQDYQTNESSLQNAMRDTCQCFVLNSELVAGGIDAPQAAMDRREGDEIERIDQNGTAQGWTVIDATYENGYWMMVLERNLRVVP